METPSQDLLWCRDCKTHKPRNEMTGNSCKGLDKQCKACYRIYMAAYRDKKRDSYNQYQRQWRSKLGDTYKKRCVDRRKEKIASMSPEQESAFRKAESDKSKRLSLILKNEVFEAYGGWICACCGEKERSFLTIDHMLNNGSQLRREGVHGHSTQFYRWLKNSGYPKDFQVLCMNCQFGKRMNNGVCPHQVRCND